MPPLLLLAQRAPALGLHVISVDPRHLLRVRVKVRVRVRVRVPIALAQVLAPSQALTLTLTHRMVRLPRRRPLEGGLTLARPPLDIPPVRAPPSRRAPA